MGAPDGVHLDGVGEEGARAVDLDAVHVGVGDVGVAHGHGHDLLLGARVRGHEGGGLAGVAHHAAGDGPDPVVVVLEDHGAVDKLRLAPEDEGPAAVATGEAAGGRVEGHAAALLGHPAVLAPHRPPDRRAADARCDGEAHLVGHGGSLLQHRVRGVVDRRQAGRRLRGEGQGGALHAEAEGHAARHHTEDAGDAAADRVVPLVAGAPDVDAAVRVHQALLLVTRVGEGGVAHLGRDRNHGHANYTQTNYSHSISSLKPVCVNS